MVEDYLALLQEHNPEFANNIVEQIKTIRDYKDNDESGEAWAMNLGKAICAITGRLNEHHSYDAVGAAFIAHYGKQGLLR